MDDAWRTRFRDRFRELKASDGLTQARLAEALGVTQGTIAHWLSGKRTPEDLAAFEKLAAALGWHPGYLLYGLTAGTPLRQLDPDERAILDEYRSLPIPLREWWLNDLRNLRKMPGFPKATPTGSKRSNGPR